MLRENIHYQISHYCRGRYKLSAYDVLTNKRYMEWYDVSFGFNEAVEHLRSEIIKDWAEERLGCYD